MKTMNSYGHLKTDLPDIYIGACQLAMGTIDELPSWHNHSIVDLSREVVSGTMSKENFFEHVSNFFYSDFEPVTNSYYMLDCDLGYLAAYAVFEGHLKTKTMAFLKSLNLILDDGFSRIDKALPNGSAANNLSLLYIDIMGYPNANTDDHIIYSEFIVGFYDYIRKIKPPNLELNGFTPPLDAIPSVQEEVSILTGLSHE